jgi:maltose O-acetyltransferase
MKSEKEKMCTGAMYSPLDKQLSKDRLKARELLKELNDSLESEGAIRRNILKKLIPNQGKNVWI